MNDPAEADLHERLQDALGRTPGNPLLVVSQKTVTGHAKGGAAAWQLDGVLRMLETGRDPRQPQPRERRPARARQRATSTLGDRPIRLAEPLKAALITSLGFGHVSAVLAIAHPDTFLAASRPKQRDDYLAPRRPPPRRGRPPPPRDPHRPPAARPPQRRPAPGPRQPKPRAADHSSADEGVRPLE